MYANFRQPVTSYFENRNRAVQNLRWSICLSSENSFPKEENLYFESLGVSEQASNAAGQFHWCFPRVSLESWQYFSKCRYKHCDFTLCPSTQQMHLFQSQGNFWNRLRFVNKCLTLFKEINVKFREILIRCEFQTTGYLVFWKPYLATWYVDFDLLIIHLVPDPPKTIDAKTTP